jgi:hypothetical protein
MPERGFGLGAFETRFAHFTTATRIRCCICTHPEHFSVHGTRGSLVTYWLWTIWDSIANIARTRRGNCFLHGPLYTMLRNPLYLGLIRHNTKIYPPDLNGV